MDFSFSNNSVIVIRKVKKSSIKLNYLQIIIFIGFDEIIKCYLGNVNSLDNKSREIVDVDTCCAQFYGKPVIGIVDIGAGLTSNIARPLKLFNSISLSSASTSSSVLSVTK